MRTLNKADTWNATSNRYSYPQTPCQVQLSLWPAGLSTNGEGTIEWAGGLVDWNSQYMVNGYYYAAFDSVSVQCYDPPSGANVQGTKSYVYTDDSLTNLSVAITNNNTVLSSFQATGLNLTIGETDSDSGTKNNTVPGISGAGPGSNGQRGGGDSSDASASGSSQTATATGSASTGFVQGSGGQNGASTIGGSSEKVLQGSLFAVIVAIVGLCVL